MALSPRLFSSGVVEQASYLAVEATEKFLPKSPDRSETESQPPVNVVVPIAEPVRAPVPPRIQVTAQLQQPSVPAMRAFFNAMLALSVVGVGVAIGERVSDDWEGMLAGGATGVAIDLLAWVWVKCNPSPVRAAQQMFHFASVPADQAHHQYVAPSVSTSQFSSLPSP